MRKKMFRLILLLQFFSFKSIGQTLTEKDLIGTWKVVDVRINGYPEEDTAFSKKIKMDMLKAKIFFKADKTFNWDPESAQGALKNLYWKVNKTNGIITLQQWKDKDSDSKESIQSEIQTEIYTTKNKKQVIFKIVNELIDLLVEKE